MGARHHSGYPWAHIRRIEVVDLEPPRFVRWRQVDRLGAFEISYELQATDHGTRLMQRDEVEWALPFMGLIGRRIVHRHIGEQHEALRAVLKT